MVGLGEARRHDRTAFVTFALIDSRLNTAVMKTPAVRRLLFPILAGLVGLGIWLATRNSEPAVPKAGADETARTGVARKPVADATRPGEDWPCFLGPQQTGVSHETGLLDAWPKEGPPVVWKKEVGTGYSAPSVAGNRLVYHHREGNEEIIQCVQADTGEPLWKQVYPSHFRDPYGYNNGPRCSPLLVRDRSYTLGAEGMLTCVALADGGLVWQRDLRKEFNIPEGFFGMGCSPITDGERLICLVGGQPNSGVAAFDLDTGKTVWESVGKTTWDGVPTDGGDPDPYEWTGEEMMISYSSPLLATIHNQPHLLCLMRQGLVSLDPKTGQQNFKYWFRPKVHESVNAARPVVVEDKILLTAAYRLGSSLLQVHPDGKSYDVVWKNPRNLLAHWSTPIALDGDVYGFSGRHEEEGEFRCIELNTGKVSWESSGWDRPINDLGQDPRTGQIYDAKTKEPIPYPYYGRGSKIFADGKFIVLAERGGSMMLVRPGSEKCDEVSRCTIAGMKYPSWTAPVLSRGYLYLRCEDLLICLDLKKPAESK
jgi:outer membrane protein assembly factor BamB